MARPRRDPVVRFLERVDKSGECWLWTGGKFAEGYGAHNLGGNRGKVVGAHRYAYELWVGPIPPGLHIDHICRNRACVNPDHLRPVTVKQNQENRTDVRGVHWHKLNKGWQVSVQHHGAKYYGGKTFKSYDDAVNAARALRNKLFTHNDGER